MKQRFLLDTNILIPLQDSFITLQPNLANFIRLANKGGHELLYHIASEEDIHRDKDDQRRIRTLARLKQYSRLNKIAPCPWNTPDTSENDACDNEILWALKNAAVHALVTEDQKLHAKAKKIGLGEQVYYIQTAEASLQRQLEPTPTVLPNIEDIDLYTLTPLLNDPFFDSLRVAYPPFDTWFKKKAQQGIKAWVYRESEEVAPSAICIYDVQPDIVITDDGNRLTGNALKLCTFKVGEEVRGRKIGELFLKAAFAYATDQQCENIFIHANAQQEHLLAMLDDFGFLEAGSYNGDSVLVKQHPTTAPAINIPAFDYVKRFYPHFRNEITVKKFIVPIEPHYHKILFPDYENPGGSLPHNHPNIHVGNAIKLAYLSHTPTNNVDPGDLILFYRSHENMGITTLGVVERFEISQDAAYIATLVSRRTVYSNDEIVGLTDAPIKVMLFRIIEHLPNIVSWEWLRANRIVNGPIISFIRIEDEPFFRVLNAAER